MAAVLDTVGHVLDTECRRAARMAHDAYLAADCG
jgi:hypothetical protein